MVQDDQALSLLVLRDGPLGPAVYAPEPDLGLWGYFVRCITDLYIEGHGRARRKEYWSFALFHFLILMLAFIPIIGLAVLDAEAGYDMEAWGVAWICIVALVYFALIVPYVCVTIRRFHDVGLSGWLIRSASSPMSAACSPSSSACCPRNPTRTSTARRPRGRSHYKRVRIGQLDLFGLLGLHGSAMLPPRRLGRQSWRSQCAVKFSATTPRPASV